jgi:hypothetical protein
MTLTPKPFLDYLDKEMTIMGILSGFCIAVIVLVVDKVAGASQSSDLSTLWKDQAAHWAIGAGALLVAALTFYRQRSHLAWYYGQITLAEIRVDEKTLRKLLTDADSWETWLYYRYGFCILSFAFIEFAIALIQHLQHVPYPRLLTVWVPLLVTLAAVSSQWRVLKRYRYHESPWHDWLKSVKPKS